MLSSRLTMIIPESKFWRALVIITFTGGYAVLILSMIWITAAVITAMFSS